MRLPVPGPRDVFSALERGGEQVEALLGAVPRALALLDRAEALLEGASAAVVRVREVTEEAAALVARAEVVVDTAEVQVVRATELVDALAPSLITLQPTLETLADTTHPDEVAAMVSLVDHLPELTQRVENDVLPVLATLGSVAPDVHDLLTVTRELNDMLAKIPGMARIRRRIDEEEGEDRTDAPVRDR
ncbi:hypothetical protein [Nocardioides astragali]|uniref:Ribulose 1,5-bisphosphate carboxylase large subunit n=1 Tax=Nocardioides astragali TaxID=1776736 RepID=A0ABW2N7C2_9ACTN|nr:hypothetical protein [Nocardioides astragali]